MSPTPTPTARRDASATSLRLLPSVDAVLRTPAMHALLDEATHERIADHARFVLDEMREELRQGGGGDETVAEGATENRATLLDEVARRVERRVRADSAGALRRVINATGVILHTNLGRAPLSEAARRRLAEEVAGYCTLEYDLATGARGNRAPQVERLLVGITGAEAAHVVNNCAAATMLVLAALAADGETIISRGELVEVGGDFRIPDVMRVSGTRMIEVGTTNRTRLGDYEAAITPATRLFARVHPSNFRVVGFTAQPDIAELSALARRSQIPLYEDAGSGLLHDLSAQGLTDEPVIPASVRAGVDVISFSGDKLLGGPQAGIIVGRRALIEHIRRTPLARALRADKLVLGALEATLEAHARGAAHAEIPALRMLHETFAESERRTESFLSKFHAAISEHGESPLTAELVADEAAIGGGSAPLTRLPTVAIALRHSTLSANAIEERLRRNNPPVIARIVENTLRVNLRAIPLHEESELLAALLALAVEGYH